MRTGSWFQISLKLSNGTSTGPKLPYEPNIESLSLSVLEISHLQWMGFDTNSRKFACEAKKFRVSVQTKLSAVIKRDKFKVWQTYNRKNEDLNFKIKMNASLPVAMSEIHKRSEAAMHGRIIAVECYRYNIIPCFKLNLYL